jgi:hypothetical protein
MCAAGLWAPPTAKERLTAMRALLLGLLALPAGSY